MKNYAGVPYDALDTTNVVHLRPRPLSHRQCAQASLSSFKPDNPVRRMSIEEDDLMFRVPPLVKPEAKRKGFFARLLAKVRS